MDIKAKKVSDRNGKSRNKMYYQKPEDMELWRMSDMGAEDSDDPMETDGYQPDQEEGGWNGEPAFEVPTRADQKDDLGDGKVQPEMAGKAAKLRKRGMPR